MPKADAVLDGKPSQDTEGQLTGYHQSKHRFSGLLHHQLGRSFGQAHSALPHIHLPTFSKAEVTYLPSSWDRGVCPRSCETEFLPTGTWYEPLGSPQETQ